MSTSEIQSTDTEKRKRTHCYVQHPRLYDIPGCPVDESHEVTWSEFEKHLWCFTCEVDFVPAYWGIFEGTIPVGAAKLLGISFDRINLESGAIVHPDDPDYSATWA